MSKNNDEGNVLDEIPNDVQINEETSAEKQKIAQKISEPKSLDPTRYGDWQYKGRVTDF